MRQSNHNFTIPLRQGVTREGGVLFLRFVIANKNNGQNLQKKDAGGWNSFSVVYNIFADAVNGYPKNSLTLKDKCNI